ncbi:MAG: hypothetical protein B7Z04_08145 [Rhodobacterales bacterium 32-66-9]|nr:MAG: hypothetical protein B7Z04_08145 [Rhodobacterales bacterium 32-66-9]
MWTKIKWGLRILALVIVGLFLHYTLPQRDVVRIVGVRQEPMALGWENRLFYARSDAGMAVSDSRTIKLIDAIAPDGAVRVYRNEDTGWGWPPYFKLDSQNVQALAQEYTSTAAAPVWVALTHYGWRSELITIFPNAVSITPVAGPDVRLIPWLNIVILGFLAFVLFMIRKMWLQFRERMVDPALVEVGETFEAAGARVETVRKEARGFFGRIGAWINTWRAKK